MLFDYLALKLIWWLFAWMLLTGFALANGFQLGVASLLPLVARGDGQRAALLGSIGSGWEGNQIWFLLAGGAVFAGWPLLFSPALSGFAVALALVPAALFLRAGFEFRDRIPAPTRRAAWDALLVAAGVAPPIAFGIVVGNLFQGIPFRYDGALHASYDGSIGALLNPFGLLAGALSWCMMAMYGAAYIERHLGGEVGHRAAVCRRAAACLTLALFALGGWWADTSLPGYRIEDMPSAAAMMSPLAKTVARAAGAWTENFECHPWMAGAPAAGMLGAAFVLVTRGSRAFSAAALSVAGIILTAGLSMFPFVLPSSLDPASSLTAWDAVSPPRMLNMTFWAMAGVLLATLALAAWLDHQPDTD